MTTQYLIRKVETCPECNGERYIHNPDWARINRENTEWMKDHGLHTFTEEAAADWERRIKECWPSGNHPPEEEPCYECEGDGKIESWVSLSEALAVGLYRLLIQR